MSCQGWEERIVADLYEETDPAEREEVRRHLSACESCRRDREGLAAARAALGDARPAVPPSPRIVVLRSRPSRAISYAVAASLAAVGLLAGISLSWSWQAKGVAARLAASAPPTTSAPDRADLEALVDQRVARILEERGAEREAAPASRRDEDAVSRSEVEALLTKLEKKLDRGRSSDVRYLLDEMAGVEARTGYRLGETQQAIRYLALASDPRISER